MDSSEANIQLRINLTPLKLLVLGYFFSVDGKIQPGLYALQTKEERSNGWWRQLQKHTSYRRAALISANYRFSKGEMDSCQSERTHQTHQTVFRNMDNWTIWLSEIFRNVCWKGAERKNLPFLKRKNPPITSEEHFLEMTELSTYSPDWEMTFGWQRCAYKTRLMER